MERRTVPLTNAVTAAQEKGIAVTQQVQAAILILAAKDKPERMKRNFLTPGFTLIELLIVISIIAILTGTIGGNYMTSRSRARDADRKTALQQMQKALELYYNDHNRYPGSVSGKITPHADIGADPTELSTPIQWGQGFFNNKGTVYMQQLPSDVHAPGYQFMYEVDDDNLRYRLYARLENTKDLATDLNEDGVPGDFYDGSAGIGDGESKICGNSSANFCNYGIPSPNTSMEEQW